MARAKSPYARIRIHAVLIGCFVLAWLAGLWVYRIGDRLEFVTLDLRFRLRGPLTHVSDKIVHVDIDDYSIDEVGSWPFTRDTHGVTLSTLKELGARCAFMDIEFRDERTGEQNNANRVWMTDESLKALIELEGNRDEFLATAIRRFGQVYLPISLADDAARARSMPEFFRKSSLSHGPLARSVSFPGVDKVVELILEEAKGHGSVEIPTVDRDGVLRRIPVLVSVKNRLFVEIPILDRDGILGWMPVLMTVETLFFLHMGVKLALDFLEAKAVQWEGDGLAADLANGETLRIPTDSDGNMIVNWANPGEKAYDQSFQHIRYSTVLKAGLDLNNLSNPLYKGPPITRRNYEMAKARVAGRVCFMGSTAKAALDARAVPTTPVMPGVAIHSNVFNTIVTRQFLREVPRTASTLILLALGIIIVVFSALAGRWVLIAGPFVVIVAYGLIAQAAFNSGLVIPVAGPFLGVILPAGVIFGYRYFTEEKTKREMRQTFDLYMDRDIVDQLLYDPDMIKGIPNRKRATVMFTDIEGFSKFAEQTSPDEVVRVLNDYLTELTETIKYYKGYVNKYLGDGTMSIFGIKPGETPQTAAENACRAAKEIQEKLARKMASYPFGRTRIGISSGEIIVGPIGGVKKEGKQEYTAIGDVVNVSSRLQGMNKELKTSILIEEETHRLIQGKLETRPLGPQAVRGRAEPVTVFTL